MMKYIEQKINSKNIIDWIKKINIFSTISLSFSIPFLILGIIIKISPSLLESISIEYFVFSFFYILLIFYIFSSIINVWIIYLFFKNNKKVIYLAFFTFFIPIQFLLIKKINKK